MPEMRRKSKNLDVRGRMRYIERVGAGKESKMAKRENGSGSIVRRRYAHRTVYVAYAPATYELNKSGKPRRIYNNLGSYAARAEAREALRRWAKNPVTAAPVTVQQVYEQWRKTMEMTTKPQTVRVYVTAWQRVQKVRDGAFVQRMIRDVSAGELRAVVADLYEQYAKNTATTSRFVLAATFKCAYENDYVERNNMQFISVRAEDNQPKKRAFTIMEFQRLKDHWADFPGGDAMLALCYLGFRVSAFCALDVADYDPVQHTIRGGIKTAAGKGRIVPVHPDIIPIVERWAAAGPGPLYRNENGKRYSAAAFRLQVWRPAREALGLPEDLTPHSARHTFATRLAAAGARPEDIARMIGHTSYKTTSDIYVNQDLETLRAAVNLID